MCGPLAFALESKQEKTFVMVLQKLSYNIGRAISYAFLGLLIGFVGKQFWIAGLQQGISILSGALIIVLSLPRVLSLFKYHLEAPKFITSTINHLLSKSIAQQNGHFYIGLLNGLLPCGFVYLGLATAVNTSSALQSALFMFVFGMGTLPLMFASMVGFNFAKPAFRNQMNRILPILTILLGIWFVCRGLNLDIPYLSPEMTTTTVICH
jgi:sulfite exporter TauE/SafE